ncbi:Uncharacterised protein [Yersinia pseudotuberculosis]|nr:Uncharacterised protein [Yersinia pseudotuberculosis]CRY74600.1 Uncharacterised protein [Yersinia pseudotuberculosis]
MNDLKHEKEALRQQLRDIKQINNIKIVLRGMTKIRKKSGKVL